MSFNSYSLLIILITMLACFIWGRWRYDRVALAALLACVAIGVVPFNHIYAGLSHHAVITVACVMVISHTISHSGVLTPLIRKIGQWSTSPTLHIATLSITTATLSAFMNNVGAFSLMLPIAMQTAAKTNRSPSLLLMPMALASALGGLTTLIGTPPNLLISAYRQTYVGHPFHFFDFGYVGVPVAIIGILMITFLLWRLIPRDRKSTQTQDIFRVQDYMTEVRLSAASLAVGKTVHEFERAVPVDLVILGLIRRKTRNFVVQPNQLLEQDDILIIESSAEELQTLVDFAKLELVGNHAISSETFTSSSVSIVEVVVPQGSRMEGRSSRDEKLRARHHINLLAISREGTPFKQRLHHVALRAGDVVLLQGETERLNEQVANLGLLPLVERGLQIRARRKYWPLIIFGIAILSTIFNLLPAEVAFGAAAISMALFKLIPARKLYDSIDWPVIIVLAALIPIGMALQSTGVAASIVHAIITLSGQLAPIYVLAILMIVTMTLSDFMNNAATTVVMAPIAVSIAETLKISIDPLLVTVALGASCSFLTPVGHQNNALILGPGGYRPLDYIRLGLPLEIIIMIVGLPLILWVWPA